MYLSLSKILIISEDLITVLSNLIEVEDSISVFGINLSSVEVVVVDIVVLIDEEVLLKIFHENGFHQEAETIEGIINIIKSKTIKYFLMELSLFLIDKSYE